MVRISPSSDNKTDDRLGLDAQRRAIVEFASREGISILNWHTEVISGGAPLEARTGLVAACDDIARLGASHLLVAKRDRLSREPLVSMLVERLLSNVGATVLAATGNNDNTPEAEFMRTILDAAARLERRWISVRTKAALAARKAQGLPVGRPKGSKDTVYRKRDGYFARYAKPKTATSVS